MSIRVKNKTSLDVIIPTYNRAEFLRKNLVRLLEYIEHIDSLDVKILVSNNCSSDHTMSILSELECDRLVCFHQKINIGGVKNVLFLLNKSTADYVMTLGDDDYIGPNYFNKISCAIKEFSPGVIFGNCEHIDEQGNKLGFVRDECNEAKASVFSSNLLNVIKYNNYASQISGLVFLRQDLYRRFIESKADNLYPQISFFLISSNNRAIVYLKDERIEITQVNQDKKDWSYSNDFLLDDKFNNYKSYFRGNYLYRVLFECYVLSQPSLCILKKVLSEPFKFFWAVKNGKNWTLISKILLPLYLLIGTTKGLVRRLMKVNR